MAPDYSLREKRISHSLNKPSKKEDFFLFYKVSLIFRQRVIQPATPCTKSDAWRLSTVDDTVRQEKVFTSPGGD